MTLLAIRIALIPLGKVWIQLSSFQLWVNSRLDCALKVWYDNQLRRPKPLYSNLLIPTLKLTMCRILLLWRGWVSIYIISRRCIGVLTIQCKFVKEKYEVTFLAAKHRIVQMQNRSYSLDVYELKIHRKDKNPVKNHQLTVQSPKDWYRDKRIWKWKDEWRLSKQQH